MNDLFPPAGFSSLVFLDASFEIVAVQDFAIRRFATTGVHLKQAQDAVARVAPPRRSNAAIGPVAQEFGDFAALGFVAGAATALVARRVVDQ